MIKIINSSNQTLAILQNVVSPIITEDINREFTFSFLTVIDNDKSSYVNYQNKVEVEDNYFNIVYTEEERTQDGIFINAQCEHVSYDLISATFTSGFTATGLFSAVATTLLSGTGFTIGTNDITASETISVNESTNARQLLMQLAALYEGELEFDKYVINLLTRRGADRGVQFRYRKNLIGVKRIVDNRKKVLGLPTIGYQTSVAELEFEQGFIANEADTNEHYELGDTIKVIDEDLDLDISLRIVKESHDTEQRMVGNVEIGNFIDDLADTLTQIQTTSVAKDNIYNGCSIGPDNGFVAERSDGIAKTSMNATNGIQIDLRDSTTASYTSIFYVQIDTATGTAKLYLAGNAEFTGTVRGSQIIGGSILIGATAFATAPFSVTTSGAATADNLLLTGGVIQIGTTNDTFRFDESTGLWMGNTVFASAPFRVSMSGSATMNDLTLTGGLFNIGTGTNTFQFNTTNGLFLGATSSATAPFVVAMSGALTVSSATITGGIIQTSEFGERIVLTSNTLQTYDASDNLNGMVMEGTTSSTFTYGDLYFYDTGVKVLEIYNNLIGSGYSIRPVGSAALFLGTISKSTYLEGNVKFTDNVGFFNGTPVSKTSVTANGTFLSVSGGADMISLSDLNTKLQIVHDKLNKVVSALNTCNLI